VCFHGLDVRTRALFYSAFGVLGLTVIVIAMPPRALEPAGDITNAEHQTVIPTIAFCVACLSLCTSVVTCSASLQARGKRLGSEELEHASVRGGTVLLGLISAGWFGSASRAVLQLAGAHRFYLPLSGGQTYPAVVTYWGVTLLIATILGFLLPLVVVGANLWPRVLTPHRFRRDLRSLSERRLFLTLPVVAAAVIVAICQTLPTNVRAALGYSAPGVGGHRAVIDVQFLSAEVWDSLGRLAFLILLIGMWEGVESARACRHLGGVHTEKEVSQRDLSKSKVLGWCVFIGVLGYAASIGEWLLIGSGIGLSLVVAAAEGGVPIVQSKWIGSLSRNFAMSEDLRAGASIGFLLFVLAAPPLYLLVADLWQGLESPFELAADAHGYIHYWAISGLRALFISHHPSR
jgi:hypothetical protein